ncbi:hypothetical protein G7054_g7965 [Neopestalotiopsis clavispora]|nr:hypothetical protein G7054_g7965 [Neopestalotiopsis clavispora]
MAAECAKCKKSGVDLKNCSKCRSISYCSRDCQKDDWKVHKKSCASNAQQNLGGGQQQGSGTATTQQKGLDGGIAKPFTALHNRTWLHNRSDKDTYRVLIDSYRLKMTDDVTFDGGPERDSVYTAAGKADPLPGFRRYLEAAKARGNLLPAWWSDEKQAECEALCSPGGEPWYDLTRRVQKAQFNDHYGDGQFAMQLRMIREQITGRGPGGQPGEGMIRMQMMIEGGGLQGHHSTVIDTTTVRMS